MPHLDPTYTPDLIMLEISFVEGRSDEIEKVLLKDLNERLVANAGLRSDDVLSPCTTSVARTSPSARALPRGRSEVER